MNDSSTTEMSAQGVAISQPQQGLVMSNAFNALEKLDDLTNTGINLNKGYLEFEKKGEKLRCILFNRGEWLDQSSGELRPTVELLTKDKKLVFTAATVIVNSLSNTPLGTALEITFLGEEKLSGGRKYHNYSLEILQ